MIFQVKDIPSRGYSQLYLSLHHQYLSLLSSVLSTILNLFHLHICPCILRTLTALDAIIAHCHPAQSNPQSNLPTAQSNCVGFDWLGALASHGARGLFLLAYQGDPSDTVHSHIPVTNALNNNKCSLSHMFVTPSYPGTSLAQTLSNSQSNYQSDSQSNGQGSFIQDWSIPHKYYTLVYQSNPHWPWSLPLPHLELPHHHNREADNMGVGMTVGVDDNMGVDDTSTHPHRNVGGDSSETQTAKETLAAPASAPTHHHQPNHTNPLIQTRKKIGFFSFFFYRHPVGRLLGEVIGRLATDKYVLT